MVYVTEDDILDAGQLVEANFSEISIRRSKVHHSDKLAAKDNRNEDGHLETTSYAIQYESKRH
jgi:hypothetical protein